MAPDTQTDKRTRAKLDTLYKQLHAKGWSPGLNEPSYTRIVNAGLNSESYGLAAVASEVALKEHPLTLRGLFYRVVSAGFFPSTDKKHYDTLGRLMVRLRKKGLIPYSWLVDNMRATQKPSSWAGLEDFAEACKRSYRLDFWRHLPDYVHVICEKDAIASVLAPVTREFDVALSPLRGYSSLSYTSELCELFASIDKPIHIYFFGDQDPSGMDLENNIHDAVEVATGGFFEWTRLGVIGADFKDFNLIELAPKGKDKRTPKYVREYGNRCAEVEAIPATELRRRVRKAIQSHIPDDQWARLLDVEAEEKSTFDQFIAGMGS